MSYKKKKNKKENKGLVGLIVFGVLFILCFMMLFIFVKSGLFRSGCESCILDEMGNCIAYKPTLFETIWAKLFIKVLFLLIVGGIFTAFVIQFVKYKNKNIIMTVLISIFIVLFILLYLLAIISLNLQAWC